MSWSIGYDDKWKRDIGYGVPAFCDHPGCDKTIHRGLSFVCGNAPYGGEHGCGLYFCDEHQSGENCTCERCGCGQEPFPPKPDHPDWIKHKATDPSWAQWRKEQKDIRT